MISNLDESTVCHGLSKCEEDSLWKCSGVVLIGDMFCILECK